MAVVKDALLSVQRILNNCYDSTNKRLNVHADYDDDVKEYFGTGSTSFIQWMTDDANANVLAMILPEGGATDVPVFVIGDTTAEKDLTFFNGVTEPRVAVIDDDGDSHVGMGFLSDDVAAIISNRSIVLQPSGDTDDYFTFATVSNIPTIYGTGSYVRIGDAATSVYSLDSEDDLLVSGKLEVTGQAYFVANVNVASDIKFQADVKSIVSYGGAAASYTFDVTTAADTYVTIATATGHATNPHMLFNRNVRIADTYGICTGVVDDDYYDLQAVDNDDQSLKTVARAQGAADPYFAMGGTQQFAFYNSGVATLGGNVTIADTIGLCTGLADSDYYTFMADDRTVGLVEVGRVSEGTDPWFQIGRDDTGVATNAITDMLVLQAGAGANNESAGFGLGISFKLGNAASEVEERVSIDARLVTATDGSEAAYFDVNTMTSGAVAKSLTWSHRGESFVRSVDSVSGVPDEVTIGGYDISDGNRALAISQEAAVAADADETKFSNKLPVRINGTTYYVMLTTT